MKPKNCRLTDDQWALYLTECQRGRMFFTIGGSLISRLDAWYQRTLLRKEKFDLIPTHVGIVGDERSAYESRPFRGPTRDFFVDDYTVGEGRLLIAEFFERVSEDQIKGGIKALIRYMRDSPRHYDFVSLLTCGYLQKNNAAICSEWAGRYINEVLRGFPEYYLQGDIMVLPAEILTMQLDDGTNLFKVVFDG